MVKKQISRFPLNEKFSRLSEHVPNYAKNSLIVFVDFQVSMRVQKAEKQRFVTKSY